MQILGQWIQALLRGRRTISKCSTAVGLLKNFQKESCDAGGNRPVVGSPTKFVFHCQKKLTGEADCCWMSEGAISDWYWHHPAVPSHSSSWQLTNKTAFYIYTFHFHWLLAQTEKNYAVALCLHVCENNKRKMWEAGKIGKTKLRTVEEGRGGGRENIKWWDVFKRRRDFNRSPCSNVRHLVIYRTSN